MRCAMEKQYRYVLSEKRVQNTYVCNNGLFRFAYPERCISLALLKMKEISSFIFKLFSALRRETSCQYTPSTCEECDDIEAW